MTKFLFPLVLLPLRLVAEQSLTLAWDPNPEYDVAGYAVYYGTASRDYQTTTNVGNVTRTTLNGLADGETYYFAVTALNLAGLESDFSAEVSYTFQVATPNDPPQIAAVPELYIFSDSPPTAVPFVLSDLETPQVELGLSASQGSQDTLSALNVAGHELTVSPGAAGTSTVTAVVSDGVDTNSTTFTVTVLSAPETALTPGKLHDYTGAADLWPINFRQFAFAPVNGMKVASIEVSVDLCEWYPQQTEVLKIDGRYVVSFLASPAPEDLPKVFYRALLTEEFLEE